MTWYAFQTATQCETRAAKALGEIATDVFLPMERQRRRLKSPHRYVYVHLPMFRGYVFAMFDGDPPWLALEHVEDERGRRVLRSPPYHVVRHLGDNAPAAIADAAMYELKVWCGKFLEGNAPKDMQALKVGDRVKIMDGAFALFAARIEKLDKKRQRLEVLLHLFGRPTTVKLEYGQVRVAA